MIFLVCVLFFICFCIGAELSSYLLNIAIGFDQFVNTLVPNGKPDETLSSRAYRLYAENAYWYSKIPMCCIDALFFWQNGHCRRAYLSEVMRRHFPEELQ